VQISLSSQLSGEERQPVSVSHKSLVQALLSSQMIGMKVHPFEQLSVVHALLSSQVLGRKKHVPLMQVSVVQLIPSLHCCGEFTQTPNSHLSIVHKSLSLQLTGA